MCKFPLPLDVFEDLVSPLIAAQHFIIQACTKRKGVLDPVLAFCISILQTPPEQRDCRKKDGALHVLGSVYEVLMRKVCLQHVYNTLHIYNVYIYIHVCMFVRVSV